MVHESEIFDDSWPAGQQPPQPQPLEMLPPAPPSPRPRQIVVAGGSRFWRAVSLLLQSVGALTVLCVLLIVILAVIAASVFPGLAGAAGFEEVLVKPGPADAKVTIVSLDGVIGGGEYLGAPAGKFADLLETAGDDPLLKALIVEVDSPGGSATASDLIHHRLKGISVPKVALLGNIAASGGYYAAVGCDHIIAHPTTVTGSIGVILETLHFEELLAKLGIEPLVVKSGAYKDMASPFREPTEEEIRLLQASVNEIYQRFVQVVAEGRRMKEADVLALADGRIFTAKPALEAGLIDAIGYREEAIEKALQLAGISGATVVHLRHRPSVLEMMMGLSAGREAGWHWLERRLYPRGAQFLYWPATR